MCSIECDIFNIKHGNDLVKRHISRASHAITKRLQGIKLPRKEVKQAHLVAGNVKEWQEGDEGEEGFANFPLFLPAFLLKIFHSYPRFKQTCDKTTYLPQ
jgi:hypothetical protein